MDDTRIEWMKVRLEEGLPSLRESSIFEEFIVREDGKNETTLQDFLNNVSKEGSAVLFYCEEKEEEEEIEVEIGKAKQVILCTVQRNFVRYFKDKFSLANFG